MLFGVTTVIYFWDHWWRQLWLGVVYSASLLNSCYIIRVDHFTNTDRDRLNWFETFLRYYLPWHAVLILGRSNDQKKNNDQLQNWAKIIVHSKWGKKKISFISSTTKTKQKNIHLASNYISVDCKFNPVREVKST